MGSTLRRDYAELVYPQIEAAGHLWSAETVFDERSTAETDELLATIQLQNEAGTTRVLEMTLSKAAVCNDVRDRYHVGVISGLQDWLWTEQQRGCIRFMGV